MKVQSLLNNQGRKVKNHYEIFSSEGIYFQSYKTIIAFKPSKGKIQLDENKWDYSVTTSRYRNIFLREDKKTTEKKIKNCTYELKNLN